MKLCYIDLNLRYLEKKDGDHCLNIAYLSFYPLDIELNVSILHLVLTILLVYVTHISVFYPYFDVNFWLHGMVVFSYLKQRIDACLLLLMFVLSFLVYLFTMEPTISLWDCSEFITAAAGLQVPHPPGSPLFVLLARLFSLFAHSSLQVAYCCNLVSVVASAVAISLLFYVILKLSLRLKLNVPVAVLRGTAFSAALAFAFTDTFWFSAVESEVYAVSSLLTVLCLALSIRASETATTIARDRYWFVLALLIGISVSAHQLNLLVILPITFLLRSKKSADYINWLKSFVLGLALLLFALLLAQKGVLRLASFCELTFINRWHLPVHSGWLTFYIGLLLALLSFAWFAQLKSKHTLNRWGLMLFLFFIGFGLYFTVIIRASAEVMLNEGQPSDMPSFINYIDRQQYGETPLLQGHTFASPVIGTHAGEPIYRLDSGAYILVGHSQHIDYLKQSWMWFPRMYSQDPNHILAYKSWSNFTGDTVLFKLPNGRQLQRIVPTQAENVQFMLNYQFGFLYFRYFLWNFAGRQNDLQANGGILRGNWITGFEVLDSPRLGSQSLLPVSMKYSDSRTRYFLLPLLFGLIGIFVQFRRDKQGFAFLLLWFLVTGLAIAFYLNMTPMQARERDYAFVGSFMAFAVWIGFGLLSLADRLWLFFCRTKWFRIFLLFSLLLLLPVLFLAQGYAGHNRANRVAARITAMHLLQSCPPNAILFVYGDNETFPLWYLQQVECLRRDVSVVNTQLLQSDWYVRQLKMHGDGFKAVKMQMEFSDFENDNLRSIVNSESFYSQLLSSRIAALREKGKLQATRSLINLHNPFNHSVKPVEVKLKPGLVMRNQLLMLDILASNASSRPICTTSPDIVGFKTSASFNLCGLVYILCLNSDDNQKYNISLWQNKIQMKELTKGRLDFFHCQNLWILGYRRKAEQTAQMLLKEGRNKEAQQLLKQLLSDTPDEIFPQACSSRIVADLAASEDTCTAQQLCARWTKRCLEELKWIDNLPSSLKPLCEIEKQRRQTLLNELKSL